MLTPFFLSSLCWNLVVLQGAAAADISPTLPPSSPAPPNSWCQLQVCHTRSSSQWRSPVFSVHVFVTMFLDLTWCQEWQVWKRLQHQPHVVPRATCPLWYPCSPRSPKLPHLSCEEAHFLINHCLTLNLYQVLSVHLINYGDSESQILSLQYV
jgi:hypothetical protein